MKFQLSRRWVIATVFGLGSSLAPMTAFSQDLEEEAVPAGWHLSATLAFVRNLPFFDSAAFVPTTGPIYCQLTEAQNNTDEARSFTNTYEFYRATPEDGYLHLTIQEVFRIAEPEDPDKPGRVTVADTKQALDVRPELPPDATEWPDVSRLVGWVLDHRETLVQSEAGQLARELNYGPKGRLRTPDYVQPRVSYLHEDGAVRRIRIYGLEALLTEENYDTIGEQPGREDDAPLGKVVENRVLEISIDDSGEAVVDLIPLSNETP